MAILSPATTPAVGERPGTADGQAQVQAQAFQGLMTGIAVIAGLTHLSFLCLFLWAKAEALAVVNVASVLCYVWTFALARQGQVEKAWALTVLEVLGHAILASVVIGWDSGFHHYILLVIPVAVISTIRPLWLKSATVIGVCALYIGLDLGLRHRVPPEVLPARVLEGLYYFNVAGTMLILTFLAGCYYYLINQAQAALREMATTDPLTRLRNRRALVEAMRHEEHRVGRGHPHLSFILCDLDHFKSINDTHGHDAGDAVLQAVSRAIGDALRKVDIAARWGGEEFLIMMPDTDAQGATLVAERLRRAVESLNVAAPSGQTLRVSLTLGVATLRDKESGEQAIARADKALYDGKHAGRNRIVCA
jgi:diguanylate cyclase (GGDEF)-like protein